MSTTRKPVLGMILKGYPRISETFISNEIFLLEKLGFSIHIFSMRKPRETFSHQSVNKIQAPAAYLPETLLRPLPRLMCHNLLLAVKNPKEYVRALKTAAKRFLRTRKSATIKHLLQAGYLVNHLLPNSGVTHLHAHFAHSPTSVALFTSRLSGLPFSFTGHAKDIYTSDPRQLKEKIGLARFVITCTEYNRRHLEGISKTESTPIHRVYHGIDTDLFSGDRQEKSDKKGAEPYQILTVARLTSKKGLPTVYRAVRHLSDQGFQVRHTLIGDGEDRRKILSMVRELGLSGIAQCIGTQPHHVVLDHYRRADLFVLGCEVAPNGDRDGIPNVFLESMAMGVPVVATRVSAIPELVEDNRTGLLVSPGNPAEMADAMARLLTDTDLRQRIVTGAKHRVEQDFNNRELIQDLAEIYEQAV
ncbi:glycosyltransferase family 4 protein [Thermodesulfobacteriota bacterium]